MIRIAALVGVVMLGCSSPSSQKASGGSPAAGSTDTTAGSAPTATSSTTTSTTTSGSAAKAPDSRLPLTGTVPPPGEIEDLAWSPDGKRFATADGKTARLWKPDGTLEAVLVHPSGLEVRHLAFSPDGKLLAGGETDLYVWSVVDGKVMWTLDLAGDWLDGIAFSPDGSRIAAASTNHENHHLGPPPSIGLWLRDVETGKALREFGFGGGASAVAFAADGTRYAYVTDSEIHLADPTRTKPLATIAARSIARQLAFAGDGKTLFAASYDAPVQRIDLATLRVRPMRTKSAGAMALSPDDAHLAVRVDDEIQIVEVATDKVVRTVPAPGATGLRYAPDGKRLSVFGGSTTPRHLDPATGTWLGNPKLNASPRRGRGRSRSYRPQRR